MHMSCRLVGLKFPCSRFSLMGEDSVFARLEAYASEGGSLEHALLPSVSGFVFKELAGLLRAALHTHPAPAALRK